MEYDKILEGIIEFNTNGVGFVNYDNITYRIESTRDALHLDTVKIGIDRYDNIGDVIEVLKRNKTQFVGKISVRKKKARVIADNPRIHKSFNVDASNLESGMKVLVEILKWEYPKEPMCNIVKILGNKGENETEMNAIMLEFGLPMDFDEDSLLSAEEISDIITNEDIKERRDMRNDISFTIDPTDSKDFDDSLSIKKLEDNLYEIGVHIADVTHYVKENSILDKVAYKRGTSVYLVDRCVPMLPERLSNNICSLNPNVDRLTFSVVYKMNGSGKILDTWFGKTITHSNRRFTYDEVQSMIDGEEGDYKDEILILNNIAKKIRHKRVNNGSMEIGGVEVKFKLDADNKKPIGVYLKEQKDANKLIEEFMLLANKSVAEIIKEKLKVCVNRIHPEPNYEKLEELKHVAKCLGYNLDITEKNLRGSINQLLIDVIGKPEENMINTMIVRCQSKAYYSTSNIGHFGLNFKDYCHFTSCIRRYSDIKTHRLLENTLLHYKNKVDKKKLEETCKHISNREALACKAERESVKYKQAEYLQDKIGQVFDAVINGIQKYGIFIETTIEKCDGLIRFSETHTKWHNVNDFTVINDSGKVYKIGDIVKVKVVNVNVDMKQVNFKLL
ncbi:MAG: VacB/RNase II family 3'-5' exoribonuclease [Candidatus Muirbacterium halophilum]|nr:VacB/RNase II family 3'-5' exoribonuclease [Candidatus Muirbacterium halophilum]